MSVHLMHKEGAMCPRCGDDNINPIVVHDPNFGQSNGLPKSAAIDISEEGDFTIHCCLDCGFSWLKNEGVASTSQLRCMLMSYFIDTIADCDLKDLEGAIDELDAMGGIPNKGREKFMLSSRGDNDDVRLEVIRAINTYFSTCDVDSLIESFNALFAEDVTEACDPSDSPDDAEFRAENGMSLQSSEVLADD